MKYIHRLAFSFAGAIMVASLCLSSAQSSNPTSSNLFFRGLEEFKAKRYHAAATLFGQAENQDPYNQELHYYMGKTLDMLRQVEDARLEYENCFRINPFNAQGQLSKTALLELASRQAGEANAPLDSPQTVQQTISAIQRQARQAVHNYGYWGNAYARDRLRLGNIEANNILNDRNAILANAGLNRNHRWESEFSSQQYIRSNYARTDAQAQSLRTQRWAAQAAANTMESANNLTRLLDQRGTLPDDATLRAEGTNLYVRYYGNPNPDYAVPEDPQLELKATAKKLRNQKS